MRVIATIFKFQVANFSPDCSVNPFDERSEAQFIERLQRKAGLASQKKHNAKVTAIKTVILHSNL